MKIYADNRMLSCGLIGGTLSRHTGNMRETQAQESVYKELDIPAEKILHFSQTHSDTIIQVSSPHQAEELQKAPLQQADGWVFSVDGWGGAILTADCVPLFLWDETGEHFALSHCGWRGVVKQLPHKTAQTLRQAGAKGKIFAWAGPHIQSCCFEVQEDAASQCAPRSVVHKRGKIFVNLNTEITQQLVAAGIEPTDIKLPYYCTCGDKENFFSWRRDHVKDSLLSFIYRPSFK